MGLLTMPQLSITQLPMPHWSITQLPAPHLSMPHWFTPQLVLPMFPPLLSTMDREDLTIYLFIYPEISDVEKINHLFAHLKKKKKTPFSPPKKKKKKKKK